jgi:hypothetical protein
MGRRRAMIVAAAGRQAEDMAGHAAVRERERQERRHRCCRRCWTDESSRLHVADCLPFNRVRSCEPHLHASFCLEVWKEGVVLLLYENCLTRGYTHACTGPCSVSGPLLARACKVVAAHFPYRSGSRKYMRAGNKSPSTCFLACDVLQQMLEPISSPPPLMACS